MTSKPFVRGPSAEVKQVLEESRIVIELLDAVNLSMTVPQPDRTEWHFDSLKQERLNQ